MERSPMFRLKFAEIDCWSHATSSISALSNLALNSSTQETIARVNRLIDIWPTDDAFPTEGFETIRTNYKKLVSGLNDIKAQSERDAKYTRLVMVRDK
jgi:SAGA-associated factor 29